MIAVLVALAAAFAHAVSTVVGHRAATTTLTGAGSLRSRAARLLRHPGFLLGQLAGLLGLGLHATALAVGLVSVVQPVLCSGLVMALALGALVDRRHVGRVLPRPRQWAAAAVVVVGLVVFLTSAAPAPGTATAHGWVLPAAVIAFGVVTGAVAVAVRLDRVRRPAVVLGACAGVSFGLTAVLLKTMTALPPPTWPTTWPLYGVLAVGAAGTVLAQWSFSAGPLVQSQPVTVALEPLVAVALAGPVFAEGLAGGPGAHLGQLVGLALLVAGVVGVTAADRSGRRQVPARTIGRAPTAAGP